MPTLPPAGNFTDPTVTEGAFKAALTGLLTYLSGLLGSDGTAVTARGNLGLGNAATATQGAGNGLDADTLDGQHASAFVTLAQHNGHSGATNNPHATTALQVGALASINNITNAGGNIEIAAGSSVSIASDPAGKRITISATIPSGGEVNTGANVGTGPGAFFASKSGVALNFRTLKLGPTALSLGYSLSVSGNDVILDVPAPPPVFEPGGN
ncbi:MAG TPA: hypothetical protein VJ924_14570 [Alphaproteobacteria bacterium]|nr:hypothetical protein [Alphaproteobacteria bacterium]